MKRLLCVLLFICLLFCAAACSRSTRPSLKKLTQSVTMQNVRADFEIRREQYDMVADLLLAHYELFLDPGSSNGAVYRLFDPQWQSIQNGYSWTSDEWAAIREILETDGLIYVGYTKREYPEVYFMFYIPLGQELYSPYSFRKILADDGIDYQCVDEQIANWKHLLLLLHHTNAFDIISPRWYTELDIEYIIEDDAEGKSK